MTHMQKIWGLSVFLFTELYWTALQNRMSFKITILSLNFYITSIWMKEKIL